MKNRFYVYIATASALLYLVWYFLPRNIFSDEPEVALVQAAATNNQDKNTQRQGLVTKSLNVSTVQITDYQSTNIPVAGFMNALYQKYMQSDPTAIDAFIDINALCDQNAKKRLADNKKLSTDSQNQAAIWRQIDSYCRNYTPLLDSADPAIEVKRALGLTSKLHAEYNNTRSERGYNALSETLARDIFSQEDPHKIEVALQYASDNGIPIIGLEWLNREAYAAGVDPQEILYRAGTLSRCISASGCPASSYTALAHCVSTITCQTPMSYENWLSQNISPVEYAYIQRVIAQIRKK
jgi:hypothetical protein